MEKHLITHPVHFIVTELNIVDENYTLIKPLFNNK